MATEEPNPGRVAKSEEQRRQRRSIFMTALIGATVTAILAAAAAFRIDDTSASTVKVVPSSTTTRPEPVTTTTEDDTTDPTLFEAPTTTPDGRPDETVPTLPAETTTTPPPATTTTAPSIVFPPPPTNPPATNPPATSGSSHMVWRLSPPEVTVQSGAQTSMRLSVTNDGTASGSVSVPPCPGPPRRYSIPELGSGGGTTMASACHSGSTVTVRPGQTVSWTDTISATSDATRYGSALSPGNYLVLVYGSGPLLLFLKMHVTA